MGVWTGETIATSDGVSMPRTVSYWMLRRRKLSTNKHYLYQRIENFYTLLKVSVLDDPTLLLWNQALNFSFANFAWAFAICC